MDTKNSDLQQLFDNTLDTITVENILSSAQISTFFSVLEQQPEWQETAKDDLHKRLFKDVPIPQFLFLSQYGFIASNINEEQYLEIVQGYKKIWDRMVPQIGFDVFELFKQYLKKTYNADVVLASKSGKDYFPLTIRDLKDEVLPHADFGPFDGETWAINKVVKQIAWNIYLTDPGQGGETIVYDYLWENNEAVDAESYGIKNLNKPIRTKFSVVPGRLVMFNSRNFHEVRPSSQRRIGIDGLLGQTADGKILAWI
ncbi:MAG TPA: hypothetical protein VGV92_05495 [Gammaproteobacteria bacterium]|nr:hypothetical protein [Gammaproteobacteria bacterium]